MLTEIGDSANDAVCHIDCPFERRGANEYARQNRDREEKLEASDTWYALSS